MLRLRLCKLLFGPKVLTIVGVISLVLMAGGSVAGQSVLTQHNDPQRTGVNQAEHQLTPANVSPSTFKPIYELSTKIAAGSVPNTIGAQPLYVAGVQINGQPKEVLYVATRQNWIFAFDVGATPSSPDRLLWKVELRDSRNSQDPRGLGAEELPGMDGRYLGDTRGPCLQTHGPVGIASTPVIDQNSNKMYVVYRTASPFGPAQYGKQAKYDAKFYMRKLDISTHANLGEKEITVPGMDTNKVLNRTGLLLQDGILYMGFGGAVCDTGGGDPNSPDPHGWIVAVDAQTLDVVAFLNTTPHSSMGGVWQSGSGLAADHKGFVYAVTGNNGADRADLDMSTELSDAIVQLQRSPQSTTLKERHFTAGNWFRLDTGQRFPGDPGKSIPCQWVLPCPIDPTTKKPVPMGTLTNVAGDSDLGSGGATVLPNGLVLAGGKQGRVYLIDPTKLVESSRDDGLNSKAVKQSFQAFYNSWHSGISPCDYDQDQSFGPNIHGSLVVWHPEGVPYALVYGMPEKDYLKAYRFFDDGHMDERPFLATMEAGVRSPRGMPGGFLSISADGGRNGILWVSGVQQDLGDALNTGGEFNGRLMAFDALTLTKLWETDDPVPFAKYIPPTVAGGKVFRAAYADRIIVYATNGNNAPVRNALAATRPVTAIWRNHDHLDLFMTSREDTGGSVFSTNWEAVCPASPTVSRGWRGWFPVDSQMDTKPDTAPLPAGYHFHASAASPVTAVLRPGTQHLDLFTISESGQVMSTVWEPPAQTLASGWQVWFPVTANPVIAARGQTVTAVWRNNNHLDLFVTARDGRVMSTFFENNSWQPGWFAVNPASGVAAPGQTITAAWRNANHLDLFMTAKDGRVMSTFFENNRWQPQWFQVASGQTAPGQTVTALWRNANHLDLFLTVQDGKVMSTFFDNNRWQQGWFPVNPASGVSAPGQTVTAVWRNNNHLDLFMTAKDGRVMSTFFENNHWQPSWFAIAPSTALAAPGQLITAVWSNTNHLDLFMTGKDGRIMTTFFDDNRWNPGGWFAI